MAGLMLNGRLSSTIHKAAPKAGVFQNVEVDAQPTIWPVFSDLGSLSWTGHLLHCVPGPPPSDGCHRTAGGPSVAQWQVIASGFGGPSPAP